MPLHAILGYAQLLRMEGDLEPAQLHKVEIILAAGASLLKEIQNLFDSPDEAGAAAGPVTMPTSSRAESNMHAAWCEDRQAGSYLQNPSVPKPRALSVLVVDDMAVNRDIAAAFLRAAGHSVTTARNGIEAISTVSQAMFDVVLLDLQMPRMDGLEAARRIRALPGAGARVPIIALSARAFAEQVEDCRVVGMNGHLAKPFTPETLAETVLLAADIRAVSDAGMAETGDPFPATQPWITIATQWNKTSPFNKSKAFFPDSSAKKAEEFVLNLKAAKPPNGQAFPDLKSCVPPADAGQHQFHWLAHIASLPPKDPSASVPCELWRWNRQAWKSIYVPGANFFAAELYEQGWRYCGPCVEKLTRVTY